ncbi:YugN family protein [Sporosarcina oncorhynchi]|uniref:YugN family protein n=1 Tax=Sporosarcina oncorhynchi TaxID=3056444 RepID=A0ABZ0L5G2_9BACL|nr:YugN family protein [Sporosarcina sp. T2O-4]WOV87467.1 YugN family protein [Sporosarcina sp. T2O-4]
MLNLGGFNQFQPPIDKDGKIKDKNRWMHAGEEGVKSLMDCMHAQNLLKTI